ncbi:hypothetical protein BD408DRAFT_416898 [Parasitella parasitica]|nr:hypothetical protein BD408DRAFT_416898 [Parasitella parasitica]
MASISSKSANPFIWQNQWNYQIEDSYLPKFYEQDVYQSQFTTFRSVSPKIYSKQKADYFNAIDDELEMTDTEDSLYEATLMNANFLSSCPSPSSSAPLQEVKSSGSLSRLRQILGHIHPNYVSESLSLLEVIPMPSTRSQFSAATSSSLLQQQQKQQIITRVISIADPCDPKGKGKTKSGL